MDEERYLRDGQEAAERRNSNYRLMKEADIPSWFVETVGVR